MAENRPTSVVSPWVWGAVDPPQVLVSATRGLPLPVMVAAVVVSPASSRVTVAVVVPTGAVVVVAVLAWVSGAVGREV